MVLARPGITPVVYLIDQHGPVDPPPPRPGAAIGFAHRGGRAERRENTLDAFRRARELGVSGLESDAWITADGEAVLDHDGTTGPRWRRRMIAAQPRAALPGHIPSLVELYKAVGADFELSLDVKDPAALEAVLAAADGAAARGRLWLCHGDARLLAAWRPVAGPARLVYSTSIGPRSDRWPARLRGLREDGIDALNLHRRQWSRDRVAAVHAAGLLAFGWDAQTDPEITRLLDAGVDAVYSDHVAVLVAAIRSRRGRCRYRAGD
jgi:glycerophosphoryl diester phosphodiesterase